LIKYLKYKNNAMQKTVKAKVHKWSQMNFTFYEHIYRNIMDSAFKDKLLTSFSELQNAIQENEEKNCVQLYKRTSIYMKKVTNRNGTHCNYIWPLF
jgi:hypothetical protein